MKPHNDCQDASRTHSQRDSRTASFCKPLAFAKCNPPSFARCDFLTHLLPYPKIRKNRLTRCDRRAGGCPRRSNYPPGFGSNRKCFHAGKSRLEKFKDSNAAADEPRMFMTYQSAFGGSISGNNTNVQRRNRPVSGRFRSPRAPAVANSLLRHRLRCNRPVGVLPGHSADFFALWPLTWALRIVIFGG